MGTNANGVTYTLTGTLSYTLTRSYTGGGGGSLQTISSIPISNVFGTAATIVSIAGTSNYVVMPGVNSTITLPASLLGTTNFYIGGSATIDSLLTAAATINVNVDGGAVSVSSGVLAGALNGTTINLDNQGIFGNGNAVASVLNSVMINFGVNGGTFLANAGGSMLDLSQTIISGFTNGTDTIEFQNLSAPLDYYSIVTIGGAQTIALFDSSSNEIGLVRVLGTSFTAGTYFQGQSGPLTITPTGSTVLVTAAPGSFACFMAGTRILTPMGDVAIEDLQAGDLVVTYSGDAAPIKSLTTSRISPYFVDPAQVMPIKIAAGAFAEGLPQRDLYVSPDHSFYFSGVLVPAQLLVNGKTICQISRVGDLTYLHLELEPHDLIIAEGVATESFLNTGQGLQPGAEPKTWEDACAPLVLAGPQLDLIRARLTMRAEAIETLSVAA